MTGRTMRKALITTAAALLVAVAATVPGTASAQKAFPTPEAAADGLVDSLARHDDAELGVVLGRDYRRVLPAGDVTEGDRTDFLAAWAKGHRIVRTGDSVQQEWSRTSGSGCTPGTATTADAGALMPVERKSLIVVSSCYTLASLTGISPTITLSSRIWQAARVGRVTVPDAGS